MAAGVAMLAQVALDLVTRPGPSTPSFLAAGGAVSAMLLGGLILHGATSRMTEESPPPLVAPAVPDREWMIPCAVAAVVALFSVVAAVLLLKGPYAPLEVTAFAPITAIFLALLSVQACLERKVGRPDSGWFVVLPVLAFLLGYLNAVDYLDLVVSVVGVPHYTHMPPVDILVMVLLSMAMLVSRVDRGVVRHFAGQGEGARTSRLLLLAVLLFPPCLALARQWGVDLGLYDAHFGEALLCVVNLAGFSLLLCHSARALQRSEEQRQAALDALQSLNAALEARVAERTAGLEEANRELQEMDRLKTDFVSTMSHELRTPLNAILGFTDVGLFEQSSPISEEQRHFLEVTHRAGLRLRRLIDDVLLVSRIEAGRCEVQFEWFEVHAGLSRVIHRMRPMAQEKGLVLGLELPPGAPILLRSDERRFEDVVVRLVDNAIRFTPSGSVSLACSLVGETLVLEVRDTGIGIRAEDFCHLFQPFRQLSSSYQRTHEGAGLSLFMCRRLWALLGGTVDVASEVGRGTCFTLRVPCPPPPADLADACQAPARSGGSSLP